MLGGLPTSGPPAFGLGGLGAPHAMLLDSLWHAAGHLLWVWLCPRPSDWHWHCGSQHHGCCLQFSNSASCHLSTHGSNPPLSAVLGVVAHDVCLPNRRQGPGSFPSSLQKSCWDVFLERSMAGGRIHTRCALVRASSFLSSSTRHLLWLNCCLPS